MNISVIVSNFNGARYLPRLIESLFAQKNVDVEVIIVDRRSTDGSREILQKYSQIKVIEEPPESGMAAGYCAGAMLAKSEYLFFSSEDLWCDENCLHLLVQQIDLSRNIVAADPWQWDYHGVSWLHGGLRFKKARWSFNSPHPFRTLNFVAALKAGEKIPFPCGGAFLIHYDSYREIGGWDPGFFLDHEDLDLGLRLWQRGWSTVTVPEAKVYHAVNASNVHQLAKTGQSVAERRYVSGRASLSIIPLKYFSPIAAVSAAIAIYTAVLAKDVVRGRWRLTFLDILAGLQILQRLPSALQWRSANRRWNKCRAGEALFSAPDFQDAEGEPCSWNAPRR